MKKTGVFILLLVVAHQMSAQVIQKPAGQPGKVSLPTPKIQPLTPADLQVTSVTLVSTFVKTDTKTLMVTVKVTVKNAGQTASPVSTLSGSVQGLANASVWVNSGNTVQTQALNGSQACTNEIVFKFPMNQLSGRQFHFRVLTDAGGQVNESNENNNYSQGILIGL